MNNLQTHINRYLEYCRYQKRLNEKTLKAYQIDLTQFFAGILADDVEDITLSLLEDYIADLHQQNITITPDQ